MARAVSGHKADSALERYLITQTITRARNRCHDEAEERDAKARRVDSARTRDGLAQLPGAV
jgi:hypothetical protein